MFSLEKRKKVGLTVCESVVLSQLGTRLLKVKKILKGPAKYDKRLRSFIAKKRLDKVTYTRICAGCFTMKHNHHLLFSQESRFNILTSRKQLDQNQHKFELNIYIFSKMLARNSVLWLFYQIKTRRRLNNILQEKGGNQKELST